MTASATRIMVAYIILAFDLNNGVVTPEPKKKEYTRVFNDCVSALHHPVTKPAVIVHGLKLCEKAIHAHLKNLHKLVDSK